ncbi:MAG: class I SAM-dependent methyltransferase [Promethearchaeota archaeon]
MNMTVAEKQFLMTMGALEKNPTDFETGENKLTNIETLCKRATQIFIEKLDERTFERETIDTLIDKGLLEQNGDIFTLTSSGLTSAREIRKEYLDDEYSDGLIRRSESKICSVIREQVYGKDLCQFNMMTMAQLTKLLKILKLTSDDSVLDLGCGIGKITEYLSDVTQASVLGVDIAVGAIQAALNRTQGKRNRLEFRVDDMDDLSLPLASVDCIIAIDTLYFVENLEGTIGQMKEILKPGGRMGLFYSQVGNPKESKEILQPDKTKLALALKKHGLNFQTTEFTESEKLLWNQLKRLYEEYKTNFQEEGILDLHEKSYHEVESMVKVFNEDRGRRYLYHVILRTRNSEKLAQDEENQP